MVAHLLPPLHAWVTAQGHNTRAPGLCRMGRGGWLCLLAEGPKLMQLEGCNVLVALPSSCVGCFLGSLELDVGLRTLFPHANCLDSVVLPHAHSLTRGIVTAFIHCSVLEMLSPRTAHHSFFPAAQREEAGCPTARDQGKVLVVIL